ncbi:receptor-like kinase [Medicago truncatula]|nr:receptor-like kinase [Medicago truncatula]
MFFLPTTWGPMEFLVVEIYYKLEWILVIDPEYCIPKKFLKIHNSSFLPYRFHSESQTTIAFFNCSSVGKQHLRNQDQSFQKLQNMITCPIYISRSSDSVLTWDLASCTKMLDVNTHTAVENLRKNWLSFSWQKPNCSVCAANGKKCRWNNGTEGGTECFDCVNKRKTIHIPKSLIFAATGSIVLGLVTIIFIKIYLYFRKKEEDQVRVDKFLEDYRAQQPTRFSFADIKRITNGFKEKLGEGAHGKVFKGKLSNEILVAVKILNNTEGDGKEFISEVGIMGKIHHINVVRLLGFCAEGIHRVLVYNLFSKGSLQSFIFPPDNEDHFMGWEMLQKIGIGIARGIEYLHQGCSHSILHFDINPHNVLLDDTLTPKISDFGLAKLCSMNCSVVSMTAARGTLGYMAPEVLSRNFGNVSLKSDIYSYGMLLLEMVAGRKNIDIRSLETFHDLLEGDIHIHIDDECDYKIAKKLAIVGLWCIQWHPGNRPSIKSVIQMLETGEDNQLTVPPNPFHPTTSITTSESHFPRQIFQMEVIQE